ncbi:MAG: hypothetical protein QOF76_1011 [Solirubrobacteraceae bacterium]|jgi:hypothetical protein|nr:hypothetical protein [Solirubrobacteraceae bacterium]
MRRLTSILCFALLLAPAPAAAQDAWLTRTLAFQSRLSDPLPLRNAAWLGTHNSFNTKTEAPTVSGLDNNQQVSLGEQLDLGMRSLELDVHFFPSVFAGGLAAPVVCHARGEDELHAGCSTERLFDARLMEIRTWLDAHPREFVLLYIEDALGGDEGHNAAAKMLSDVLGDKLYKPIPTAAHPSCVPMPLDTSRVQMRAAGAQVLAISHCGAGTAWPALVWDDAERAKYEEGPDGYEAYPACDPDDERTPAFYQQHFMRFFEDSTQLSAAVDGPSDGITPAIAGAMIRCGVDLFGFDQLVPDDPRLSAVVWTWTPGAPRRAGCTLERASDARWRVATCSTRRRVACVSAGTWSLGKKAAFGAAKCRRGRFGVPRTGLDAQLLHDAMVAAGAHSAWVRHRVR